MRRFAFIITVLGIFVLALLLEYDDVQGIEGYAELEELEVNTKVRVTGNVAEERILYEGTKLLKINDIEVLCECSGGFEGEEVFVEGAVSEYEGKKQVEALRIVKTNHDG